MTLELGDIRWLFFDVGCTLVNEDRALEDTLPRVAQAFSQHGVPISADDLRKAFAEAYLEFAESAFGRIVEHFFDDPSDRALIRRSIKYPKHLEEPYPDAHELLSKLSGRYRIGVIANQPAGTWSRLESYGLTPFISLCISSTEASLVKPDPEIFRRALRQAGCQPHEAVMIGDRIDNDIRPAKALGWKTVRVLQGIARVQTPKDSEDEADVTVGSLRELMAVL